MAFGVDTFQANQDLLYLQSIQYREYVVKWINYTAIHLALDIPDKHDTFIKTRDSDQSIWIQQNKIQIYFVLQFILEEIFPIDSIDISKKT